MLYVIAVISCWNQSSVSEMQEEDVYEKTQSKKTQKNPQCEMFVWKTFKVLHQSTLDVKEKLTFIDD